MPAPIRTERVFWATYRIKGAYYYQNTFGYRELRNEFSRGSHNVELLIEREPNNRHDPKAIKVMIPGCRTLIGYIGKEHNEQLGALMDQFGMKVSAVMSRKGTNYQDAKLYMDVYLEKNVQIVGSLMVNGSIGIADSVVATPSPKTPKLTVTPGEDIFV